MQLVIAEKPSVAQSIAAARGVKEKKDGYIEGGGYLISWCVGHLVQLAEAAAYGEQYRKWSYDSLPILPQNWQYIVAADKGKQFKILKELMHRADVSEVVNACDAGREGELIFRFHSGYSEAALAAGDIWMKALDIDHLKIIPSAAKMSTEDSQIYAAHYANIATYAAENIAKFITGARDLSEFDAFTADIEAMNIEECIACWQHAMDTYLSQE